MDALIQRYLKAVASKERSFAERLVDGSDGIVRNAEVRASIIRLLTDDPRADEVGIALLEVRATNSGSLDSVKEALRLRFESFRSSPTGYALCSVVQLAVIGVTILEMMQVCPLADADRESMIGLLFRLVSEESASD